MAGIGGSIIMLPLMAYAYEFDDPQRSAQHVFQAAAMTVNVLVAVPATRRHSIAGAVRWDLARGLLPWMIGAMIVGVFLSNRLNGLALQRVVAVAVGWDCVINTYRIFRRVDESKMKPERASRGFLAFSGAVTGLVGGVAGLGGGILTVPLLQLGARVPLKQAIATSAAVMCLSSLVGATLKLSTLHTEGRSALDALLLAGLLAPGAIFGAMFGAHLTHKLPVNTLRIVVSILLLLAAVKLALG
jgi:uncharacterized protein